MIRPVFTGAGSLLLAGAMIAVGTSTFIGIARLPHVEPADAIATARTWQPFGGPAWTPAAHLTLAQLDAPADRDALLRAVARRYPLEPDLWLERARTARAMGHDRDRVLGFLEVAAAVHPNYADVHWQAAMLALQLGDTDVSEHYLRRYVELNPRSADRAVAVAGRWQPDPGALLDAVVPADPEVLDPLLRTVIGWPNWPLAAAIWQRLPAAARTGSDTATVYVDNLLRANKVGDAVRIWQEVDPDFVPGAITNGSFDQPLRQRTEFDWRITAPAGVEISRTEDEYTSPPAALRIRFDGRHNPSLRSPAQSVVLQPGADYRLTGYWRGDQLTTRALPALVVIDRGSNRRLVHLDAPGGDWDWQPFELEFTAPEAPGLIRIELQRRPSRDLDRLIGGVLYLDDLALQQAAPESDSGPTQ